MTTESVEVKTFESFSHPSGEQDKIESLKDEIANLKAEIDFLHERLGRELLEDRKRIAALEYEKPCNRDSLDKIYTAMTDSEKPRPRLSFQGVAEILGISKRAALYLKEAIALDGRFVFLPSNHKQRLIVGLKEDL